MIIYNTLQPSRSLPAFGIKPAVKRRPSVYNIVHNGNGASEPVEGDDDMDNQLYVDASQVPRLSHAKGIEVCGYIDLVCNHMKSHIIKFKLHIDTLKPV